MLPQGYHTCNKLGVCLFLLNIFSSLKIKKIGIVIYAHEDMIGARFQMYSRDLLQNKMAILNFMFLDCGVHIL